VIGGSGLYAIDELTQVREVSLETPFGEPSGDYVVGRLPRPGKPEIEVVFLPRHGVGHPLLPSEVNYRANVHGLKQLGVTHLLSVSAVGSLREAIAPGHLVVADQLMDRTVKRENTFFGAGAVGHVQFGDPMDAGLRAHVIAAGRKVLESTKSELHDRGSLVVIEGPAFSTRAESEMYRRLGCDIIGMTALPEAKLAREAEIAYSLLALVTDYDCWHEEEAEVSVDAVMAVMRQNVGFARTIVMEVARNLPVSTEELPWPRACEFALMTAPQRIPALTRQRLDLIIGHYLSGSRK
jgi:5'-methylthioadenosine phosphorylase